MTRLLAAWDGVLRWGGRLATLGVALMAAGICLDLIGRNLGVGGLPWMLEAVEYLLYLITFAGAAWVLSQNGHVRVEVAVERLPERPRRVVGRVGDVLCLLICLVLVYYGLKATLRAYAAGTMIYKSFHLREWWPLALLPVGGLMLAIEFLVRVLGWRPERVPAGGHP